MLPGLGAQTAFLVAQRQGSALQERFADRRDNKAEMARFREVASQFKDVESLLKDRRALTIALEAFQLEGEIDKRGIIRKVLTEPPNEQTSLANRMTDRRWRQLAQAFATSQPSALAANEVALLTTTTVRGLARSQVAGLTSEQVAALSTTQVAVLGTAQIAALSATSIAGMEARDVAALDTAQIASLQVPQLVALGIAQMRAIETQDIAALSTAQLRAFASTQLAALDTAQLRAMGTTQLASLTLTQSLALSTTQLAALTAEQRGALSTRPSAALRDEERVAPAGAPLADPALIDRLTRDAMVNRFEKAMGQDNPGLREALYFRRTIGSVTTIAALMSDRALTTVVRGSLGLPASFAVLDFDKQRDLLAARVDFEALKDPKEVDRLVRRYLALAAPQPSANNAITALFDGGGRPLTSLIGSTLSLRA